MTDTATRPAAQTSTLRAALRAEAVTVQYGGHRALDNVSAQAEPGTITGFIGPNGAGKTTFFNACTGVVTPTTGTVHLGEVELTRLTPAQRAQRGLGRTFQRIELFDSMTVIENVSMGREARLAGRAAGRLVLSGRAERADIRAHAVDAVERCGIAALAGETVQDLSTGQRRLVELARAIATGFAFLLLDEPSSGLDVRETAHVSSLLEDLVARDGLGVLLVEHDMAMVRALCSYTYVLDFGQLIYEGDTADVLGSEAVRVAYLGSEAAG